MSNLQLLLLLVLLVFNGIIKQKLKRKKKATCRHLQWQLYIQTGHPINPILQTGDRTQATTSKDLKAPEKDEGTR